MAHAVLLVGLEFSEEFMSDWAEARPTRRFELELHRW